MTRPVRLASHGDPPAFLALARNLIGRGVQPEHVLFLPPGEDDLFAAEGSDAAGSGKPVRLTPAQGLPGHDAARWTEAQPDTTGTRFPWPEALLHSDPARFALAYRFLWRQRSEPRLCEIASDADVAALAALARSVRRDMHKMKAFVRFRRLERPGAPEVFVAWFEPEHHIVEATGPFFMRRFAGMAWSILTPRASAHWTGEALLFGPGARREEAPDADRLEALWTTYYCSIFNPARLKLKAMTAEMPKKYWRNMPETRAVPALVRGARAREEAMIAAGPWPPRTAGRKPAMSDAPEDMPASLPALATAEAGCRRCPLHLCATQAVPGEGPPGAPLMFVGEQPGDQEDLAGRPFVGPAGKVFDAALARLGIARETVFVTNAVKHFKFEPRGKRRIHKKPDVPEIEACRWWLDLERALVRPRLIVAMGATAARGVLGRNVGVNALRGRPLELEGGAHALVTVHPSYLLRLPDEAQKREEWNLFLTDLNAAKTFAGSA